MATYKICFIPIKLVDDLTQPQHNHFYTYNLQYNYTVLDCLNKYANKLNIANYTIDKDKDKDNNTNINNTYIVINNNYIAHYNEKINTILDKLQTHTLMIECIPKLKGGSGFIDMFASIGQIGEVFFFLLDLIVWIGKFIIWFMQFIGWLFKYLFYELPSDVANGLLVLIVAICKFPLDICVSLIAYCANSIGGWMTSIWGWDQSNLTKRDKNSNYFKSVDRTKGKKCFLTNTNTVPFSILLGTILCPPLGVFMNLGLTGWFNILICILLTLLYYLPGLFYALLVIYA